MVEIGDRGRGGEVGSPPPTPSLFTLPTASHTMWMTRQWILNESNDDRPLWIKSSCGVLGPPRAQGVQLQSSPRKDTNTLPFLNFHQPPPSPLHALKVKYKWRFTIQGCFKDCSISGGDGKTKKKGFLLNWVVRHLTPNSTFRPFLWQQR